MSSRRKQEAPGRVAGFTLVELLVVIFIASMVITGLLLLYSRSTAGVRTHDSYLTLQRQLRFAMETLKSDMRLAGFMATGNIDVDDNVCEVPDDPDAGTPLSIRALRIDRDNGYVPDPNDNPNIESSSITLFGDFSGGGTYNSLSISGTTVTFQDDGNLPNASETEWDRFFGVQSGEPHRFLRITTPLQFEMLYPVTAATGSPSNTVTLSQTPIQSAPPVNCGVEGQGAGHTLNVAYYMRYRIWSDPRVEAGAVPRPALVREHLEFDGETPLASTRMIVASNIVDMQFYDFVFDEDGTRRTPDLVHYPLVTSQRASDSAFIVSATGGGLLGGTANEAEPEHLRAVTIKLTACEPEQDYDVTHLTRASTTAPIRTYRYNTAFLNDDRAGAARCMTAAARVQIRSLMVRNLKQGGGT